MKVILTSFALFSVLFGTHAFVQDSTWCPPEKDISPCSCSNNVLRCNGIAQTEVLRKVFGNSAGHSYKEVHIIATALEYIPREIFDQVQVKHLYILLSSIVSLFDSPPQQPSLMTLDIAFSSIYRVNWTVCSSMTSLQNLTVINTPVLSLDKEFGDNMPKSLEEIHFLNPVLESLKSGAFKELVNLKRVEINGTYLTALNRDIFPATFNGRYLLFTNSKINSIAEDLFTQMPNLVLVDLSNNKLYEIPEAMKGHDSKESPTFVLNGNPLNCDCESSWYFFKEGRKNILGTCAYPDALKGRDINTITTKDFEC